jgi:ComF family protein
MGSRLREAALDALAVLLPVECAGCGRADRMLCEPCAAQLSPALIAGVLADGTAVRSGLAYLDTARDVILAVKEQGATPLASALAPAFGAAITAAVALAAAGDVALCAVPSTRAADRRRGYRPVGILLAACGLRAEPAFAPALPHPAQKALSKADREANAAGTLRLGRSVEGRRFVLVDDVVTTGSTLQEAARVLRAGGAEVVSAATVAATPRVFASPFDTGSSGSDQFRDFRQDPD